MSLFEITIQRKDEDAWPVVVRHQPGAHELALWSRGRLDLDLDALATLMPSRKEYGLRLGEALFRGELRDAFVRAVADAKAANEPLRTLLNVEAEDLRPLHWEQVCAPLDRGWDYLLLNQGTPFSLYQPSQIQLRFPPIGRRDLRALLLVAGPEELNEDYGLAPFDVAGTVASIQHALGEIPSDVLAPVDGAVGPPTLNALCEHLTAGRYTLLHVVCHGRVMADSGETVLYFPGDGNRRPVPATILIERLGRLDRLPHFTFLSTCESADPQAEAGLGGLGQRLVRELGMPAVVAMTGRISIETAGALASAFYARLREVGEVDRVLCEALAGLQGRYDVTVPALYGRLGGRALWSDTLDRPLTEAEIRDGLEQLPGLLEQRAPVLLPEFRDHSTRILASLGAESAALSTDARRERDAALAAVNQLCLQALDLSFNALALGQPPPAYDDRCPFRGLFPFRAEDREFFFGRQALVDKLSDRLGEYGFLAVLGPSGSGKSSLVLAGLVPALQEADPSLRMAYLTPGSDPPAQLDAALTEAAGGDGGPDLMVVDQFEELFTLCPHQERRRAFVDHLLAQCSHCRIVITMRADFWGDCAAFPVLKDEMQDHQELVGPMEAAALRRAMERQADHVGLRFEDGLGEEILDDVEGEPGAMPLLQHALLLLWQRRHGSWLRWEEYRAIGGIRQAIAHTADEVYQDLAGQEQAATAARMRDIFLRLTRLEDEPAGAEARDTRRRVGLAELVPAGSEPAETIALVKRLADARLVVTSLNVASGQEEVEVAHEALIRHWPRLRAWLEEDRAGLHLREGVREAALDWEAHQRDKAYLVHRGGRLEDAVALAKEPRFSLNELEQAYVDACVVLRERERERELAQQRALAQEQRKRAEEAEAYAAAQVKAATNLRKWTILASAIGVIAVVMAIAAGWFGVSSNQNARLAEQNAAIAQENADLATTREAEARAAEAIAQENADLAATREAEARVAEARAQENADLAATREAEARAAEANAHAQAIAAQGEARIESGSEATGALLVIESLQREPQTLVGHRSWAAVLDRYPPLMADLSYDEALESNAGRALAFSPDGSFMAVVGLAGLTQVWDLKTEPPQVVWGFQQDGAAAVAFRPGEQQLAIGGSNGTAQLWDVRTGELLAELEHGAKIQALAFSSDGNLLAVGGFGSQDHGQTTVWGIDNQELVADLASRGDVVAATFSPDGSWLATIQWHSQIEELVTRVWDLEQKQLVVNYLQGDPKAIAFSPDSKLLASGGYDDVTEIWALERTGREDEPFTRLKLADIPSDGDISSLAFDPGGASLAIAAGGTVQVLDVATLRQVVWLDQAAEVDRVAFLSNGRQLATGGKNRARLWDLFQGKALATRTRALEYSLSDYDEILDEIPGVCQRLGRNLTNEEWQTYFPGEDYHRTCEQWPPGE